MWPQLGWFSGLVCVGSVAGAVAWGAYMQTTSLSFEGNVPGLNAQQRYSQFASSFRWLAAFFTLYPVELLCFIIAKLIMLGRLTNNAARRCETCDACV